MAAAKSLQLCLTLCDPIDGSPPGSPIPGEGNPVGEGTTRRGTATPVHRPHTQLCPALCDRMDYSLPGKNTEVLPTPVFLSGECHEQRSLAAEVHDQRGLCTPQS